MSRRGRAKEPVAMIVRATLLLALGAGLALAQLPAPTPLPAQLPAPITDPALPAPAPAPIPPPAASAPAHGPPAPTWVFAVEWLHWWGKDVPAPPLLTTSQPADDGVLGRPTTTVVAGGGNVRFRGLEGVRGNARACVGEPYGLDLTGFYASNGGPYNSVFASVLAVPYVDPATGRNASLVLADPEPNGPAGYAAVQHYTQLYGAEVQAVVRLSADPAGPFELLAGVRYAGLSEDLVLQTFSQTNAAATFLGTSVPSGTKFAGQDEFWTRNHFLGAQAGVRGRWATGRCTVEAAVTFAVGTTHQEVTVSGDTSLNVPPTTGALGYVFSQTTNLGRRSRDEFTILPQGRVAVGYNVFDLVRVFVGYDVLYWSRVVRPGSQIDERVSPSLIPLVTTGDRVGTSPAPRFVSTTYWATGLSLGVDISF